MQHPEWLEAFDRLLEASTAGLPQDQGVKWTHLDLRQIVDLLAGEGLQVSRYHVAQMLRLRGYKKRKLLKMNDMKEVEQRNEQFEKIGCYRSAFTERNLPVLSIDTKKKEMLGSFHRAGQCYSTATRRVNDHDFSSFSQGRVVPHGIYDVNANRGYMTLGTSSDTSEFVCDNLRRVWVEHLQYDYPQADTVLLLCDGGGSNASAHYIVKQDLAKLSKSLGISILVAHYPPYCSKYNPIEHRLFSQVSHTWQGVPFCNIQFVKELTDTTATKTGLTVSTTINAKTYATKRPLDHNFKNDMGRFITFDEKIPKWNYLIKPGD